MRLKRFIEYLNNIAENRGDTIDVVMADNIPVVKPVYSDKYPKQSVVITDQS